MGSGNCGTGLAEGNDTVSVDLNQRGPDAVDFLRVAVGPMIINEADSVRSVNVVVTQWVACCPPEAKAVGSSPAYRYRSLKHIHASRCEQRFDGGTHRQPAKMKRYLADWAQGNAIKTPPP